ncbi:hypothetical protein GGR50DRAFT_560676 [Xylaria sp. CBS 124048]|nr:hypothetical protein GGR50DRAFT_560676 [Xylaria sp. CBS 124048]
MASLLPRAALLPRSITTGTSAATSLCTSKQLTRLASSKSAAPHKPGPQSQPIPPESPFFINVPNPPQDQSIEARRELKPIRGFIPIPRRIFAHRDSRLKPRDKWIKRAAPPPTNARSKEEPASELQAWRRQMAEKRRENLSAGLKNLWQRKGRTDEKRKAIQTFKLATNKAAAMAPEREDERLTRSTINEGTLQTAVLPDPFRFKTALASAERTAAIATYKSQLRSDDIQTLYMSARSFIVTEADLEAAVDKEFTQDRFMGVNSAGFRAQTIWDTEGEPRSVASMMGELQRSTSLFVNSQTTEATRTVRRQRHVAEELTGGKMDSKLR